LEFNVPFQHKYGYIRDEYLLGIYIGFFMFAHVKHCTVSDVSDKEELIT